jgi:hypothetical protein
MAAVAAPTQQGDRRRVIRPDVNDLSLPAKMVQNDATGSGPQSQVVPVGTHRRCSGNQREVGFQSHLQFILGEIPDQDRSLASRTGSARADQPLAKHIKGNSSNQR